MLAQLRLGVMPIHIETGYFTNTKLERRLCSLCKGGKIEDEIHFALKCPMYNVERDYFVHNVNKLSYSQAENLKMLSESHSRSFAKY